MNPLAIHPGAAHLLLQIMLIGWAAIEVVLACLPRRRHRPR
jgi:hypothetical protein